MGQTTEDTEYPEVLQQVNQTVLNGTVCKESLAGSYYADEDMFFCATGPGTTCSVSVEIH